MFFKILILSMLLCFFSISAYANNIGKALMLLSAYQQGKIAFGGVDREISLGHELRDLYLKEMKQVTDPEILTWVDSIFKRIVVHTHRKELTYECFVLENDAVNAFAIPGGPIFLFSGLLKYVDSDAELAGVIAHELTHIEKRHALKLLKDNVILGPLINLGLGGIDQNKANLMLQLSSLQYQRDMELEADAGGIDLCIKAGYDPKGIERFLYKISSKESVEMNSLKRLLRTHPVSGIRIQQASWKIDEYFNDHFAPMILSYTKDTKENTIYRTSFELYDEVNALNINAEKAQVTENVSYTGLYSLELYSKNGIVKCETPFLELSKDQPFVCDIYALQNSSSACRFLINVACYNNERSILSYIKQNVSAQSINSKWNKLSYRFKEIPEKTKFVKISVSVLSEEAVILDDLSVHFEQESEQAYEPIQNSDFEQDADKNKIPDLWAGKNISITSQDKHSGDISVKLGVHKDEYSYILSPQYTFHGGEKYIVSLYCRSDDRALLQILSTFYNEHGQQIFIPGYYDAKIETEKYWYKRAFYLDFRNISPTMRFNARLKMKLNSGTVYIDTVKIDATKVDYRRRSRNIQLNIWNNFKGKIEEK